MSTGRSESSEAPRALAEAGFAFLRRYPPFDGIEREILQPVLTRTSLGYYSKDSVILQPADGVPEWLYIVQRGTVHVRPLSASVEAQGTTAELSAGECFSVGALLEKRAAGPAYVAATDVFCYQVPAADFQALIGESARFRDFATAYLASLLRDSRRLLKMHASSYMGEESLANQPLRSLITRKPVCSTPETPIGEALRAMQSEGIGSILVVDDAGLLTGILTRHDVLDRVALAGRDLSEPIRTVMSPRPKALRADETAYDAALLIAQHGIRHVPVTDNGTLVGVVTERDLFALQRANMRGIRRAISRADDLPALQAAAREIRSLARLLLEQGVGAEQLTYIVSTLNDALTTRIIDITRGAQAQPQVEWAWLAFGSEGRYEQTISTDQDNGLIFEDATGTSADAQRQRLLPFASVVNETLAACGFPLCKGNIMAGNAQWCLSASEWKARFTRWVRNTDTQELLSSVIFFDLRVIYGVGTLATPLLRTRDELISERPVFLRQLAQYAIETRPPLSLFGGFSDDDAQAPGTIDLKNSGARIFTDAARVLALAAGVNHTNTAERLRLSAAKLHMAADDIGSATEAFFFIQSLRLRSQLLRDAGRPPLAANRVDPRRLNEVDRRMLKEAFRQARKLQSRLALDYQL